MMIKLTDDQIKALGCKDPAEASAAIANVISLSQKNTEALTALSGQFTALETKLTELEKKPVPAASLSAEDKETFLKEVKGVASQEAMTAIGNVGHTAPVNSAPVEGTENQNAEAKDEAETAEAALKAKWNKDANLRAEFLNDFETYQNYSKAVTAGRVRTRQTR